MNTFLATNAVLTTLRNVGKPLTIADLQSRMTRWLSQYDLEIVLARLVKSGQAKEGPATPARTWIAS